MSQYHYTDPFQPSPPRIRQQELYQEFKQKLNRVHKGWWTSRNPKYLQLIKENKTLPRVQLQKLLQKEVINDDHKKRKIDVLIEYYQQLKKPQQRQYEQTDDQSKQKYRQAFDDDTDRKSLLTYNFLKSLRILRCKNIPMQEIKKWLLTTKYAIPNLEYLMTTIPEYNILLQYKNEYDITTTTSSSSPSPDNTTTISKIFSDPYSEYQKLSKNFDKINTLIQQDAKKFNEFKCVQKQRGEQKHKSDQSRYPMDQSLISSLTPTMEAINDIHTFFSQFTPPLSVPRIDVDNKEFLKLSDKRKKLQPLLTPEKIEQQTTEFKKYCLQIGYIYHFFSCLLEPDHIKHRVVFDNDQGTSLKVTTLSETDVSLRLHITTDEEYPINFTYGDNNACALSSTVDIQFLYKQACFHDVWDTIITGIKESSLLKKGKILLTLARKKAMKKRRRHDFTPPITSSWDYFFNPWSKKKEDYQNKDNKTFFKQKLQQLQDQKKIIQQQKELTQQQKSLSIQSEGCHPIICDPRKYRITRLSNDSFDPEVLEILEDMKLWWITRTFVPRMFMKELGFFSFGTAPDPSDVNENKVTLTLKLSDSLKLSVTFASHDIKNTGNKYYINDNLVSFIEFQKTLLENSSLWETLPTAFDIFDKFISFLLLFYEKLLTYREARPSLLKNITGVHLTKFKSVKDLTEKMNKGKTTLFQNIQSWSMDEACKHLYNEIEKRFCKAVGQLFNGIAFTSSDKPNQTKQKQKQNKQLKENIGSVLYALVGEIETIEDLNAFLDKWKHILEGMSKKQIKSHVLIAA